MKLRDEGLFREDAFIDGAWRGADERMDVTNPATGAVIANVPKLDVSDVDDAIAAAERAMTDWKQVSAVERSKVLHRWFELMVEHSSDLAELLTSEQGKPIAEAQGEIAYGASYVEWFAEEAKRIYGDLIPSMGTSSRIVVLKQPIGVCAAITPWNFPNAMLTRKIAPALAAGCAMVLKPAAQTPLSALALAELGVRAGFPKGLLNIVTGSASVIGGALTASPIVRKLTFTGSTEIGKLLLGQCAQTVKKVTMELGGNAPFIVFKDADLDAAVAGAMAAKFRNSGQTCVCVNRFLVQREVVDEFTTLLANAVSELKVGNGLEPGVQQGPLIDENAVAKVESLLADAVAKGGAVVAGGQRHSLGGTFFQPTVLANANRAMELAQEEVFGPVAPIFAFDSEEEALELANDTNVGLAGYFYTRDLARAWRVADAMETGMVAINTGLLSNAMAPFGGIKESGLGREGSKYGIDDYLQIKYVLMGGLTS